MGNKQMLEYVALADAWNDYLEQVAQLLEALDLALIWDPNNRTTLENIVHLCKDNIEGVSYRDPYDNNTPKCWTLAPAYEQLLRSKLVATSERLRQLDPLYVAPTIEKKKADSCFVVTATMGDENHPTVTLLRRFRAEFLSETSIGEAFIHWYYRHGPKLARAIKARAWSRALSYALIVAPAAIVASVLMFLRRK